MRGFLLVLPVSMLLLSCGAQVGGLDCKPSKTLRLSYPISFETTREERKGDRTVLRIRVKERARAAITISYDQVARTERWIPHDSPPAMSLSRAIELATEWLGRERSDEDAIEFTGAYLAHYGCHGEADYWYYGVRFSPFSLNGDRFESSTATIVVLMDGTVIGPKMAK